MAILCCAAKIASTAQFCLRLRNFNSDKNKYPSSFNNTMNIVTINPSIIKKFCVSDKGSFIYLVRWAIETVLFRLAALSCKHNLYVKGSLTRDFRLQVFFMNQCPPGPQVFRWCLFEFFRKFAEIFAN